MKTETQKVEERYEVRKLNNKIENIWFAKYMQHERELKYFEIVKNNFKSLNDKKLIEIGAGGGR